MGWPLGWFALLLHAMAVAGASLVLPGMQARAVARWRGADGPALDQPVRDMVRLWRKETVLPAGSSFVFAAAPVVSLALAAAAALLVPSFTLGLGTAPVADLVVVGVLLAASRLAVALAAWDAGSALSVHAATRGVAARVGVGPVWLLAGFAALLLCGSTNVEAASMAVRDGGGVARLAGGLAGMALFTLVLGGPGARLDACSGRLRLLAGLAESLRGVALLGLAAGLACPFGLASAPEGWVVGLACWMLKLVGLGLLAAAWAVGPRRAIPAAAGLAMMAVVAAAMQGAA